MDGAQQLPSPHDEPCFPQQMRVFGLVVVMPQSLFVAQHCVALEHATPGIMHAMPPPEPPPAAPPAAEPPAAPPPAAEPPAMPPPVAEPPAAAPPAALMPPALPPPATPPPTPPPVPPPEPDGVRHCCVTQDEPRPHARHCSPPWPHAESTLPGWQSPETSQHPVQERLSHGGITPPHADERTNTTDARKNGLMPRESHTRPGWGHFILGAPQARLAHGADALDVVKLAPCDARSSWRCSFSVGVLRSRPAPSTSPTLAASLARSASMPARGSSAPPMRSAARCACPRTTRSSPTA